MGTANWRSANSWLIAFSECREQQEGMLLMPAYGWIQTELGMRSIPSAVLGPVLSPPWSLHRPFAIAGHRQGDPSRFLAPQRAPFEKSPEGLPFLSIPRRFSWGVSSLFTVIPHPLPVTFPTRAWPPSWTWTC